MDRQITSWRFRPAFLLGLMVLCLGPMGRFAAADPEEPLADPLPFRRELLPPERMAAQLERVQQGVLVKLSRDDFEARVNRAAVAAEIHNHPARLAEAFYRATLGDTFLTGTGRCQVVNPAKGPNVVTLEPFNLAMQKAQWQKAEGDPTQAILGELDGTNLGLLVEQPGTHTVLVDWTARGDQSPGGLHFLLQVPPCPVATLELNLPADQIVSPREHLLLSGPFPAEVGDRRLWRVNFSGRSQVDLEIRRDASQQQPPPLVLATVKTRQQLEPDLLRADFEFNLEVPNHGIRELHFDCDPTLRPFEVRCTSLETWEFQPGSMQNPSVVSVHLHEPFSGGPVTIRCQAPLPFEKTWSCPGLRLAGAIGRGETVLLSVHPDVRLENFQPGSFHLVPVPPADSPANPGRSEGWLEMALDATVPAAGADPQRPSALVKILGPAYRTKQLTWWQITPDTSALASLVTFEVNRGRLFRLPLSVPAGWEVNEVKLAPPDLLRSWSVLPENGQRILMVELQRALGSAPAGTTALLVVRLRPTAPMLPANADIPFPDLVPLGAGLRHGVFGITVDPTFQVDTMKASVPSGFTEDRGPWASHVLDYSYPYNGLGVSGTIRLQPRPPQIKARCRSEFVITSGQAAAVVRLVLEPEVGHPDTIDLVVSAPVSGPWNWKTRHGHNQVRKMQRLADRAIRSRLATFAGGNFLTTAVLEALQPQSDDQVWRLTLARPLRDTVELETTLDVTPSPASKEIETQSAPPGNSDLSTYPPQVWKIPLLAFPAAAAMEGDVTLHLGGNPSIRTVTNDLQEMSGSNRTASPSPGRTFHYGKTTPSLTLVGWVPAAEHFLQEAIDQVHLTTYLEPAGHLLHQFEFRVWNWRQQTLTVCLPAGARPLAVLADRRWITQIESSAQVDGAVELPVPAGRNAHEMKIVYSTEAPAWRFWDRLYAPAPKLPVLPAVFRRTWCLSPLASPLGEKNYLKLPGSAGAEAFRANERDSLLPFLRGPISSGRFPFSESFRKPNLPQLGFNPEAPGEDWIGKDWDLEEYLDNLVFKTLKGQETLILDAVAFREAGLEPETLLGPNWHTQVAVPGQDLSPSLPGRGVVLVPCQADLLMTTRSQWEGWQTAGPGPGSLGETIQKAVAEAAFLGHDCSGRFRNVGDWLAEENANTTGFEKGGSQPFYGAAFPESFAADWVQWEPLAEPEAADSLVIIRRDLLPWAGLILAGVLTLAAWRLCQYSRKAALKFILIWLAGSGLAFAWLPAPLDELARWPTFVAALTGLAGSVWRRPSVAPQAPALKLVTGALMALAFGVSLPGQAAPQTPATVYLVSGLPDSPEQQLALAPQELLDKLQALAQQGVAGPRPPLLVTARYQGNLAGTDALFQAEFQVHSFADETTTLSLPLGGIQLQEALLDGSPANPVAFQPPRGGYGVTVAGHGLHKLSLRFTVPIKENGDNRDLEYTIPDVAQSRLLVETPPGSHFPFLIAGRGFQQVTPIAVPGNAAAFSQHLEADLGRVGAVHVQWRQESGPPQPPVVQVREAYLWDLLPSASTLYGLLQYSVKGGAATTFSLELPDQVDLRAVEAGRLPDANLNDPVPRLKEWRLGAPGNSRQVQLELQRPVSDGVQFTLELVPRIPLGASVTLPLPVPLAAATPEGKGNDPLFAYKAEGITAQIAENLRVQRVDRDMFKGIWQQAGMGDPGKEVQAFVFQRTPTGPPFLRLNLGSLPPDSSSVQQVNWQVGVQGVELTATAHLADPGRNLVMVRWQVPAGLLVAEVTGPDVRNWSQTDAVVQVWLQRSMAETTLQLFGSFPLPGGSEVAKEKPEKNEIPNPFSPLTFHLSPLPVLSAHSQKTFVTVTAGNGLALKAEDLKNLLPLPSPRSSPREYSYVTEEGDYGGTFHAHPVQTGGEVQVLTLAEIQDRNLTFTTQVDYQSHPGEMPSFTVRLRNWPGGDIHFDIPRGARRRELPREPNGRAWSLEFLPSIAGHNRIKITCVLSLTTDREILMPVFQIEGTDRQQQWVAIAGKELRAEGIQGLASLADLGKALHSWPAEEERIHAGGAAWEITNPDWQLRLLPNHDTDPPVQTFLSEQSAAVMDGRHWVHRMTCWLYHENGTDLGVVLPPGATLLSAAVEGEDVTPLDPRAELLWLPLPGPGGMRTLSLSWRFSDDQETLEHPNLERPILQKVADGPVVWIVHIPPGYEASERGKTSPRAEPIRTADHDLYCADAQLQLSSLLVKRIRATGPGGLFLAQLRTAQERFFDYCRQADHRLAAARQSSAPVADLKDKNRRLMDNPDLEVIRGQAEKHHLADQSMAMAAMGTEAFGFDQALTLGGDVFAERGTATYWQTPSGNAIPRLSLTSLGEPHVARSLLLSVAMVVLALAVWVLGRYPTMLGWVQFFWPELLILAGWLGWQTAGPAWGFLLLVVLGIGSRLLFFGRRALGWMPADLRRRIFGANSQRPGKMEIQ